MGFEPGHTIGFGTLEGVMSEAERRKALGNTFQVTCLLLQLTSFGSKPRLVACKPCNLYCYSFLPFQQPQH